MLSEDKVVEYPNAEVDGLDEDVGVTLKNEAAASLNLGVDWDPWAGAENKPFQNKQRVTRSIGEIMDKIFADAKDKPDINKEVLEA